MGGMKTLHLRLLSLFVFIFSFQAQAMSVDWDGTYRFEYVNVDMPNLSSAAPGKGTKGYFLNHLNLSPKIIAVDGINVVANIEVLPSLAYPGSQLGTDFGSSNANYSFSGGPSSPASQIEVNQLYMNWNHEYGAMVAGRAPVHFGLGITQNAGQGAYDHWMSTHDMVGYKFLIGNLSFMPSLGRTFRTGNYSLLGGSTEQMWNIEYTNPETESTFAVYHQIKSSSAAANDGNIYFTPYFATASVMGGWNTTHTNLFIARGWQSFRLKMEAGFQAGGTGVNNGAGAEIKLSGFGIAMDLEFPRPESKFQWKVKLGIASGDNPNTADQWEGYYFNRNYDVAFLLFNHPMGGATADVFRTKLIRRSGTAGGVYANDSAADDEAISNAMFLAPQFNYVFSEKWEWSNNFTFAQIHTAPAAGVASDLGLEWDTGFVYKPHEKVRWQTDFGFFFPGSAWKFGGSNLENSSTYGIQTKASISF
jgi:hypothetical protein